MGQKIRLKYVPGHSGVVGNEGADGLAVRGVALPQLGEVDWDGRRNVKAKLISNSDSALKSSLERKWNGGGLEGFDVNCREIHCFTKTHTEVDR